MLTMFWINSNNRYNFLGTWQVGSLKASLGENLLLLPTGKVLVDEIADVDAMTFNCNGFWRVNASNNLKLKAYLNIFPSAEMIVGIMKLFIEGYCSIAGYLAAENILAYVRKEMKTTSTGGVNIKVRGTIIAGAFRNNSNWHSEGNLTLNLACCEQSEDAIIMAKHTLNLSIYDDSEEDCCGRFFAGNCIIKAAKKVRIDGYIRVNHMEITIPYLNESCFTLGGQLEILSGPLILKGKSELYEVPSSVPHPFPAFILEGQLKAEAIIAPFLSVRFNSASYALLSGIESIINADYRTMISAGYLHTMRASLIDSCSKDNYPEAILCATTWFHEGHVRFHGEMVHLVLDTLINWGRLANEGKLQNHMKNVRVFVENYFKNESVFSANKIDINGNGKLENKNRIFAVDSMNIQLSNFSKADEYLSTKSIKLLSVSNECSKMNNSRTEEKENLELSESKLFNVMKRFGLNHQIRINAQAELLISSDVKNDVGNLALAAREVIIFESQFIVDNLELTLGPSYETEIIIRKGSNICSNQLRLTGTCKYLTFKIYGELNCESIICEESLKNIRILGPGSIICRRSFNASSETISFLINQIQILEFLCNSIKFIPKNCSKINAVDESKTLTVYADEVHFSGILIVEPRINLKCNSGSVHIVGELTGMTAKSELCIECGDLLLDGHLSNFDFLEIYARKRIDYCPMATIKNSRNIAMEAAYIIFCGTSTECRSLTATADEIVIRGTLSGHDIVCDCAFFAKVIRFEGFANRISKLELNSDDVYVAGTLKRINLFEIDSKFVRCGAEILECNNLKIVGSLLILGGRIRIDSLVCFSVESAIVCGHLFVAESAQLWASFVVFLGDNISVPQKTEINAVFWVTNQQNLLINRDKINMNILIDSNATNKIFRHELESFMRLIKMFENVFNSSIDDFRQTQLHSEQCSVLESINQSLPVDCEFATMLQEIVEITTYQHVRIFNIRKLIKVLRDSFSQLQIDEDMTHYKQNERLLFSVILTKFSC